MNLIAILIFVIFILLFFTVIYNILVRKRNEVDNAFGGIDIQLKRRYDLIPNLVAAVKKYTEHEKELLSKLTEMRVKATGSNLNSDEKVDLDNQIAASIRNIILSVENYPELKANENFINLQNSLNEAESQISAARRTYNAVITDYNNAIQSFPSSIIAKMMGLMTKPVFSIPDTEKQNINISKLFQ